MSNDIVESINNWLQEILAMWAFISYVQQVWDHACSSFVTIQVNQYHDSHDISRLYNICHDILFNEWCTDHFLPIILYVYILVEGWGMWCTNGYLLPVFVPYHLWGCRTSLAFHISLNCHLGKWSTGTAIKIIILLVCHRVFTIAGMKWM